MSNVVEPLYLNWTFWSFVVAFTALIFSIVPQIILFSKGKKLNLEIHNKITVNHWYGYPNLSIFIGIVNKGRSKLKIKSITAKIIKESTEIKVFQCSSYYETIASTYGNLFTPFELASEESWSHLCWFGSDIERLSEQKIRSTIMNIDKNIAEKARLGVGQNNLIETDYDIVEPLIKMHDEKFLWLPGEYSLQITIHTEPHVEVTKKIRFTLYESDSNELNEYFNDYKYGQTYHLQKNKGILIPLNFEN